MKKVLSLLTMALLCTAAWAGEKVVTFNGDNFLTVFGKETGSVNGTDDGDLTEETTGTYGGVTLTVTPATGSTPNRLWAATAGTELRMYGGSLTIAANKITKIVFTHGKWYDSNKINGADPSSTKSPITWTSAEGVDEVVVTVKGNTQLKSIEVTFEEVETPAEPTITFDPAAGEVEAGTQVTVTAANVPEGMKLFTCQGENGSWTKYGNHTYTINADGVIRAAILDEETDQFEISWYTINGVKAEASYTVKAAPAEPTITFNPAAGEVEAGTQVTVTAANVPAGMKLFARQGENSWSKYITTFTVNEACTIQAAILDENTDDTEISWYTINGTKAEANYTIKQEPVVEPKIVFNPEAGEIEAGTEVTITVEGAQYDEIQYSLDGSNYVTYNAPVAINESCTLYAQAIYVDDNEIEHTVVTGSARYTVVAPEPTPVITLTPDGGTFDVEQEVLVEVENLPADASIYFEFEKADGTTTGEMMLQGGKYTVTESGYLTVRVVREADDDEAAMRKAPKTGVLAEKKSAYYTINATPTGVETLTAGKAVKSVRYFNVAGQQAANAFQGVNIVVVDYQDGTQAVAKVVK